MSIKRKIIKRARVGDPVKYTGSPPLPPSSGKRLNEDIFSGSWSDEDPSVCLNCTREKCAGEKDCYLKRKKEREDNENCVGSRSRSDR